MKITVFYSWQSDLPGKFNQYFIRDSLQKAISKMNEANTFDLIFNVERDTQNETGTPSITESIFNKIDHAQIFVADVTVINSKEKTRKTPNPNVLIELGYAAAVMGWENVICICNEGFSEVEELPFDLRFRRQIKYNLNKTSTNRAEVESNLVGILARAIKEIDHNLNAENRRIKKEFAGESDRARHLVTIRPAYWSISLIEELLRNKLTPIMRGYSDLADGLIFRRSSVVDERQLFNWYQVSVETFTQFYNVTKKLVTENFTSTNKNAIELKRTLDKLVRICEELLEWEIELSVMIVPDELNPVKELFMGSTVKEVEEINSIPDKIKEIMLFNSNEPVQTITLSRNLPERFSEAGARLIKYIRDNNISITTTQYRS